MDCALYIFIYIFIFIVVYNVVERSENQIVPFVAYVTAAINNSVFLVLIKTAACYG